VTGLGTETNPEDDARDLALNRKCVVFIGAGMSNPPGQQWQQLVEDIARQCGVKVEDQALPETIDLCQEGNPNQFEKALREQFPKHVARSRTALHYLLRLPFKAYITTNFDPWLRQISTADRIKSGVHVYPDLSLHEGLSGAIYYIHGCFDSEDRRYNNSQRLVFGAKEFARAYSNESLLPGFLLSIFTYEHIIFLGFDPSERHVADLLNRANAVRASISDGEERRRFLFWPLPDGSDKEKQALWDTQIEGVRALDITPIIYDPEGADHRGLERKLYEWVEQGDMAERPAPFKTGFDLTGISDNPRSQQ
jgi:hypothetical protein